MYQTILKFRKTAFVLFKHNHLKCLFFFLDYISLLTVSTLKLVNFVPFGCHSFCQLSLFQNNGPSSKGRVVEYLPNYDLQDCKWGSIKKFHKEHPDLRGNLAVIFYRGPKIRGEL